jgi:hypothetical protein
MNLIAAQAVNTLAAGVFKAIVQPNNQHITQHV